MPLDPSSGTVAPDSPSAQGVLPRAAGAPRLGAGSWLLASAVHRMAAAVVVSALLWILTGWAMQWW